MQRRNIIIIAVAVVLGLFAVFLANTYFTGREEQQKRLAEQQQMTTVAVATQDLEFGSVLTPETVRLVSWPNESVPTGAFTSLANFKGTDVAIRPIARGEPVLNSRISERAVLSENIPENMRAITVPVNDVTGVAGFVTPGDAVDVYLTRTMPGEGASNDDKMTTVVLENVQVLAIDRRSSEKSTEPQELKMATLLVLPEAAQKLVLANEIGRLSLALRNVEDQMTGTANTVTTAQLGGRSYRRASYTPRTSQPRRAPTVAVRSSTAGDGARIPPAYSGPSMTVYRGTEGESQEVSRGTY